MKAYTVIIGTFSFCVLIKNANSVSVEELLNMSIGEVQPHHSILWTNIFDSNVDKSKHLKNYRNFLKNLLSQVPTTQISMNKPTSFNEDTYLYDVNISAPIHYFFFIAQDHGTKDALKIANVMNQILNSIMYMSMPKLFFVFYQTKESFWQINTTLSIARYGGLVDSVILQVIRNKPPMIYLTNFTSDKVQGQNFIGPNSKLFSDNIKNISGYNLRVGVHPIWNNMKKNLQGYPANLAVDARLDKLFEYFHESLNVTTKFIVLNSPNRVENIRKQNLEMVLSGGDTTADIWNFDNIYILKYSKLVALVPLIHKTEITGSKDNLQSCLILLAIIVGMFLFFKYSRYSAAGWSWLNIFNLMLGNSANVQLQNLPAKLAYGLLLAISIFFISDMVSDLTAVNYENKQELLAENVDEILQKNLSVCSPSNRRVLKDLSKFGTDQDREVLNIKKYCFKNIEKNQVMITYEFEAERRLYENLFDDINNLTVVDMNLPITINSLIFRKNSVFRMKLRRAEMRFREFGLEAKWASDLKIRRMEKKNNEFDPDDHGLVISLMLFLLIGWGISITVFLLELIWYHVIRKLNVIVFEE